MKKNLKFLIVLLFWMMACGGEEQKDGGVVLDVELPSHLTQVEKENMLKNIEFYRFQFSGNFSEMQPIYIERKKFKQYTFSNIPFDDRLHIRVDAVSLNQQVVYCTGDVTVQYYKGKKDRIVIPVRCV